MKKLIIRGIKGESKFAKNKTEQRHLHNKEDYL